MFQQFSKLTIAYSIVAFIGAVSLADAQIRNPNKATETRDVGVDEHVGALLPLDATFVKEDGIEYPLGKFFQSDRPVVLSLNYSDCPMMCSAQLESLVAAMRQMEMKPGTDFDFMSISIDPQESVTRSRKTKDKYLKLYAPGKETAEGWHFLTGEQEAIDRVTAVVGFRYEFVRATKDYIHPPVFVMCSPDGKIMRYVHGLDFRSPEKAQELEEALIETGAGKEGSSISKFIFACFLDRSYSGQYSLSVMKTMRTAGGMTVVILLCTLLPFWLSRSRNSEAKKGGNSGDAKDVSQPEEPQPQN